ncbi:MAG: type II toxin-antitoxin system RelE/ParE family toxin [Candidatus Acidiferrales bacterium]
MPVDGLVRRRAQVRARRILQPVFFLRGVGHRSPIRLSYRSTRRLNGVAFLALPLAVKRRPVYSEIVIKSFRSRDTERLHLRESVSRFKNIERVALRKLRQIDASTELRELVSPPSNRLEALHGNRKGQHSIRINDQWRICFAWREGDAYEVEITDYH